MQGKTVKVGIFELGIDSDRLKICLEPKDSNKTKKKKLHEKIRKQSNF